MSDTGDQTETALGTQPSFARPAQRTGENRDPPTDEFAAETERPIPPFESTPRMLGRRYLLEERIASGGMASVWRAHDEVLARTVAVKVLHDHLAEDAAFRERFRREAVTAARLTHPNIVSLFDTGSDGDQVYLVMEFVDGSTLRDVIADVGMLEVGQVAAIGAKIARALDYAHSRGLVHRDVKPANILIGEDGSVKVADFGIAKADRDSDLTRTGMVLGTAAYVAPEQVLAQPLTGQADQYALGCVLYEALTGRRPFKGESPVATAAQRLERDPPPLRSLRPGIPRGLEQIITRCLSREPAARFLTCAQLADALDAFADSADDETVAMLAAPADRTSALPLTSGPSTDALEAPAAPPESFLRSEGRWLAPVLALLALAGALVGVGLATGVLEAGPGGLFPRFAQDVTGAEEGAGTPLAIAGVDDFDPLGDRRENADELPLLIDRDPTTAWRTEGYDTADLGGLKEGVGFYVDIGRVQPVSAVRLGTTTPGIDYDVLVSSTPAAEIGGWRRVASVTSAPSELAVSTFEATDARYVLIWVRGDLQRQGRFHYAGFSEITVEGARSQ